MAWYHFTYADGCNNYIAKTQDELRRMLFKYEYEQTGERNFHIIGRAKKPTTYAEKQNAFRDIAIKWQNDFYKWCYTWQDVAEYGEFFETYGKRYGLLKEFRENGII